MINSGWTFHLNMVRGSRSITAALVRRLRAALTLGLVVPLFLPLGGQSSPPAFWSWAQTPVMGWNSWDFYGTSINEERTKAQANYMAANLLSHGWNLITVDIQWYQPTATGFEYIPGASLTMDQWGRLTPALNRFPSATGGLGFKPLADYVHSKGLKFGIHMMRGIPRQAVARNTPILGTTNTASQIADASQSCPWNTDMYGIDMSQPGAQAYYDSVLALAASWGVDFVKFDDLSRPYHVAEIEAIRKAIDKTGRAIVFSTSPGATLVAAGPHVMEQANQWRVSDDFWDNWTALYDQFLRLHQWTPYRGPGHFPDADMLPLGRIGGGSPTATGRWTYFTASEQYAVISLWAIARSPLIYGGDMTQMDPFTLSLLSNEEVIAVNQASTHNRQLSRNSDLIVWTADTPTATNKYLGVFNASGAAASVPVNLSSIGVTGVCNIRYLWDRRDLGSFSGTFSPSVAAHAGELYRISGSFLPVPWITSAMGGSNRVDLSWEPISSASSFSVKRSTCESGSFQTIASGLITNVYTDASAQMGTTYFYVVSAWLGSQQSPDSAVRSVMPAGVAGIVSWNYDRYGTVTGSNVAGAEPAANWNNSYPNNPTVDLVDNAAVPTSVNIQYNSFSTWSIQDSHPGTDANGRYDRELLNGYLNSGNSNTPTNSYVSITQIPYAWYDLYVYFSSDTAGRLGTVTDGSTTFTFRTLGQASINNANGDAVLTQTTDTTGGNPPANYAVFAGISGSRKTIQCRVPLYGGIAAFQIVPGSDPLAAAPISIQRNGAAAALTLSWPAGLGLVSLQRSSDLQAWLPLAPQPASNSIAISIAATNQFFRLTRP